MSSKYLFLYILYILFSLPTYSQENILSEMQGLSYKDGLIFEVEGYNIIIEKNEAKLDEKDIKKIKKKYELKEIVSESPDKNIKWQNYVIESKKYDKNVPEVIDYQLCYLIPETDNTMTVVLFESPNRKDTVVEQAFMNAFFNRQLNKYIIDSWSANEIDFAGRKIPLGDICSWISPYNVHCPSFGQISWSVFKTLEDARINNEAHLLTNNKSGMYKVLKQENVNIIFEGIPTECKRVIYKINKSKVLLGGRNELAVYYIVQKIRGKYISCVLSHYIEDKKNYRLAPLLEEVMSIDNTDNILELKEIK